MPLFGFFGVPVQKSTGVSSWGLLQSRPMGWGDQFNLRFSPRAYHGYPGFFALITIGGDFNVRGR